MPDDARGGEIGMLSGLIWRGAEITAEAVVEVAQGGSRGTVLPAPVPAEVLGCRGVARRRARGLRPEPPHGLTCPDVALTRARLAEMAVTSGQVGDGDDRWSLHVSDRALLGNKSGATRLGWHRQLG